MQEAGERCSSGFRRGLASIVGGARDARAVKKGAWRPPFFAVWWRGVSGLGGLFQSAVEVAANEGGLLEVGEVVVDLEFPEVVEFAATLFDVLYAAAEEDGERFADGGVHPFLTHAGLGFVEVEVLLVAAFGELEEHVLHALDVVVEHALSVACDEAVEVALEFVLGEFVALGEEGVEHGILDEEDGGEFGEGARFFGDAGEIGGCLEAEPAAVGECAFSEGFAMAGEVVDDGGEEKFEFEEAVGDFREPSGPEGAGEVGAFGLFGKELADGAFEVVGEWFEAAPVEVGGGDPAVADGFFVEGDAAVGPDEGFFEDGVAHVFDDGVGVGAAGDFGAVRPDVGDVAVGADHEVGDGEAHGRVFGASANAPLGGDVHPGEVAGDSGLAALEEFFCALAIDAGAEGLPDDLEGVAFGEGEFDKAFFPAELAGFIACFLGDFDLGGLGGACERLSCGQGGTSGA